MRGSEGGKKSAWADHSVILPPEKIVHSLHPNTFHRYNAAHARARNVVERQYGVWEKRFSCIDTPFRCSLETAQTVIVATAVLHNHALSLGDYEDEDSRPLQQDDTMVNHSQEECNCCKFFQLMYLRGNVL
ncbi:nuclease HARBI1 [Trichonephila clavipes]|nr:nuclease HARBI1 [Trichonephila clavipes]